MDELRKQIDQIDEEMLNLLAKRAAVVQNVAEYKAKNGLPIFQPDREVGIYAKLEKMAVDSNLDPVFVLAVYRVIIEHSKLLQTKYIDINRKVV